MTQDADHGGLLWIKGNPGIGKSTLMKFLFEEARRKARGDASQITLSFFFLARGTDLEKSVIGLYRSLLHQLFEKAPQLKESLEWMTSDGARVIERTGWHKETLKQTLAHAVQSLGGQSFTVFVDALDECDEDEVADMVFFFEGLCDCARDAKVRLQVCFSSRHYPTIVIQRGIEIVLEDQTGHTADIEQYIKSKLRLGKSKAAEELRSRILEKSSNIFLWVVLVLDILNSEYPNSSISLKKAQERLNQIPPKLSELFEMILERDGQNREQLQLCLKWILFATRPLKPPELYFAVQLGLDKSSSGHWDPDDVDPDQINTFVRSSSKGLAEVTRNKASEVQFIHESVRDFLLGKYAGQSPEASSNFIGHSHEILKDCCIAQLSTRAGNCTVIPEPLPKARETAELREKICSDHPFLEYAVINVYRHANGAQQNEIEQENFLAHFNRIRWILLNNVLEKFDSKRYTGSASLLYLLAERDLDALIRIHPQGSSFLVEEGERYGVPLLAAVANGSNKAVKTFLELKAKSRCQKSRLHAIYEDYCTDSAGQLLPSRNFTYSRRRGVLSYLVEYGSTRLVEFVLTTGECNLKLPDHDELPKLSSAVQQDPDTLAQLLPDGQDQTEVNHEVEEHDNQLPFYRRRRIGPDPPLWCTIKARKYSMTKLLLDAGVDTEVKNFAGRLPLSEAVINNDEVLTKLLLEAGADKEGGDRTDGRTPLLWATYYGYEAIVKLLLETGVDTEGEDANGQIPLILAIENGQENIVRLLIQANADLEGKGTNGQTPLVLAVEKGQESIARLLIKAEADVEAKDAHGRTALLAAAQYDREISARLLLEVGADIEGRDSFGRTSLLRATEYKSEAVLKLLLKAGADMEVRDSTSQTPLLIAAYWRNGCGAAQAIVKPLLDSGADMEARDSSGQTPLSRAAHCGNEAIVKLLLEAGADMEARDLSGQTPLSRAAYFGIEATVELLLEAGAEIEAEDNNGQTPLSLALRETCNATVIMLLLQAYRNRGISNLEPLLLFAKEGNVHMVSVFLEEGANPSVKDEFGRTPIWYAHMNNFKRIVRMLLDAGASREEMEG
jgi:ankyrin repeat protein